jgi:hypothetical protein
MRKLSPVLLTLLLFLGWTTSAKADVAFEVRLTQAFRVNGKLDVDVEIRSTGSSSFVLGTSVFLFDYDTAALGNPTKIAANDGPWDSNSDGDYNDVTLSSGTGYAGLTVLFGQYHADYDGPAVPSTFTRIGTVQFNILDTTQSSGLVWRGIGMVTEVLKLRNPGAQSASQDPITSSGTFETPDNTPLVNVGFEVRLTQAFRVSGRLDVDVEIRRTASPFVLATSTLLFNYNTAGLGNPLKIEENDGPWDNSDADYDNVALSSGTGYAGLTVVFRGGGNNNGLVVPSTFTRIGTVQFTILDPSQSSDLVWRGIGVVTEVSRLLNPGVDASPILTTSSGTFVTPDNTPLLNFGFEVRLKQVFRESGKLDVDVEIRRTGGSFVLGTSTLLFDYNTAGLESPTKIEANDGPWDDSDADYDNVALSSGTGYAGLTVVFQVEPGEGRDMDGPPVPSGFTRIGTVQFAILDPSQSSGLVWRGIGVVTEVSRLLNPGVDASPILTTSSGTFVTPDNTPLLNFGFEVRLKQVFRESGKLDVDVEIRRTGGSFVLGTSTLLFDYNTAGLESPTKIEANDGPWDDSDADYDNVALSSGTGYAGLTVVFEGGAGNDGTFVPSTFTRVGTVQFDIVDPGQSSGLVWRAIGPVTEVSRLSNPGVNKSQSLITSYGRFEDPFDTPLFARANIKVFLEGPFSSGSMSTALNSILPPDDPYSLGETADGIPAGAVDWILVQLRTGTEAVTTVASRAAFLMSDGSVVDLDGSSTVAFSTVSPGNYYIVIRHRNHLAVMSRNPVPLSTSSDLYDFTTGIDKYWGSDAKQLAGGVYGMYAGDVTGDGVISLAAELTVIRANNLLEEYNIADVNLDGVVSLAAELTLVRADNLRESNVP